MTFTLTEIVFNAILVTSFLVIITNKEYREAVVSWLAGIMEDKESAAAGKTRKAANKRFVTMWAVVMVTILAFNYLTHPTKFAWEMWASFFGAVLVGAGFTTYEKLQMKKMENGRKDKPQPPQ